MSDAGARPALRPLLVWCAGVHWDAIRGTDRHLVTALSSHADVLWVDPPLSIARRLIPRGQPNLGRGMTTVAPGVTRLTVLVPPLGSRRFVQPAVAHITRRAIRKAARHGGRRTDTRPAAMVLAVPEPFFAALPDTPHVYFATDDFTAGASLLGLSAHRLLQHEREIVADSDLLVGVTQSIVDRWADSPATRLVVPNGCVILEDASPLDPRGLGLGSDGPTAVVVGQFSARIDLALLEAVAHTGAHLLLVGPHQPSFEPERFAALVAEPNVDWVGQQPYDRIASYLRAATVGLTPYADTSFNRASFPLKTLEYLAAGRAVVSTPLPAVDMLGTGHVTQAGTPADFAAAVEARLEEGLQQAGIDSRQEFARAHSWDVRARQLLDAVMRMAN